ncbi:PTS fructose transporter subunit IIABC [Mesomycoplasma dispar]|uniref:PTS fructose transporter subunit IIABC n=1 Tax=Mesomycoplasma dispar TaxID=86660 RepID=A0ABM6PRM1_9BACT|nr:fructose-specific PTS transporter subunit EIIC [Mesomycoplasma dispar]ATP59796.1 PTS fructose transporter subunit IIABC [Mesomycoplasma dispar]
MEIFEKDFVFLLQNLKTKNEVFEFIAKQSLKLNIATDEKQIIKDLQNRESQIPTGLESGFAIPHTQSESVLKPALFFISLKDGIDWQTFDNSLAKYLFCILLPKNGFDEAQVNVLAKIASLILDPKVKEILKSTEVDLVFANLAKHFQEKLAIKDSENKEENFTNLEKVVAITSCTVGIAHTYLAAEKLEAALKTSGYHPKIETRGSVGPKNILSESDIKQAKFVIIAADVEIDTSAFWGKKVYFTNTKDAIHQPKKVIENAEKAPILKANLAKESQKETKSQQGSFIKHIMTGISYMIPYVVFGGIMIALSLGIGKAIYGNNSAAPKGDFLWWMLEIGLIAFKIMIGVLGAYIAYSIAGRSALAPGFIVATVANSNDLFYGIGGISVQTPMGFIGAVLFGLLVGISVKYLNTLKIQKSFSAIMPIFVIPIGVSLFWSLMAIFVIGAPIGYVLDKFIEALKSVFNNKDGVGIGIAFLLGLLLGGMAGFDMGGPVNKVAFLTSTALVSTKIYEPMGMMAAAIPVAPFGMGIATLIWRKKFSQEEKSLGISALVMGFIGISEGAIPFAIADPKRVITANVIGSAVAGGLAGILAVTNQAGHGGPIVAVLGAVGSLKHGVGLGIAFFFLSVIVGSLTTTLIYGFLKNRSFNIFDRSNKKFAKKGVK